MKPLQAIKAKCLDCSGNQANEVKLCPVTECPLYLFRFGKNPNMENRQLSKAQMEALQKGRELLKKL